MTAQERLHKMVSRELLPKCGAPLKSKDGAPCNNRAGMRTSHEGFGRCWRHGGNSPTHIQAALKADAELVVAEIAQSFFGREIVITPNDAMLKELYRSEAMVEGLQESLARAHIDSGLNDKLLLIVLSDAGIHEAAAFVKMFREERDHLVRVANACKVMGVLDAQIKFIESQGDNLGHSLVQLVEDLGHDVTDPKVRAFCRAYLDRVVERAELEAAEEVELVSNDAG